MKHLLHNHATAPLRLDFPPSWPVGITSVTLGIYSEQGDVLRAPAATTLPAATTTTVARVAGDETLTLAAVTVTAGSVLRVSGQGARAEDVTVDSITGLVVTLSRPLRYDHPTASVVEARHVTATQATTAATWVVGNRLQLVWKPNTTTPAHTEIVELRSRAFALAGLRSTYQALYPDEYRLIEDRWDTLESQSALRVSMTIAAGGRSVNALKDQRALEPVMLGEIRKAALTGASQWQDRAEPHGKDLAQLWERFLSAPNWYDQNEDDTKASSEVADQVWRPGYRRNW